MVNVTISDFKENNIIPLASLKKVTQSWEKMFSIILTIFCTGGWNFNKMILISKSILHTF